MISSSSSNSLWIAPYHVIGRGDKQIAAAQTEQNTGPKRILDPDFDDQGFGLFRLLAGG